MSEQFVGETVIAQHVSQTESLPSQDVIENPGMLNRLRKIGEKVVAVSMTALALAGGLSVKEQPAYAEATAQAVIGMPFPGKWGFNQVIQPPYTDANSSHPSVHASYGFHFATDLYPTEVDRDEVLVYGSSPNGTVTFKRSGTSDTCSTYGQNIGGRGVTFDVLINANKVGEVKYDHLDLDDVGNDPIPSGTKIGEITSEPTHPTCYQVKHAHIQLKNTTGNYACYVDHGNVGKILNPGNGIGVLGSRNTGPRQACTEVPAGGGGGGAFGSVENGRELTDGNWVYTKQGDVAWPIKPRNEWSAGDAAYWGGGTLAEVPSSQIHQNEVGYTPDGRVVGAHPPRDGTALFVAGGSGQQYYVLRGRIYPIGVGELDDLGVRDRAVPIPATGDRLSDFTNRELRLGNGEIYRFAGQPTVRQLIYETSGGMGYYINNDTVKDCLRITQGKIPLIVPQQARSYMPVTESPAIAGCSFPSNTVLFGPGGGEQWKVEGNNPYVRRRYFTPLDTHLNSGGNPQFATFSSTPALNGIPEGAPMTPPEGVALENTDNGQVFVYKDGDFHLVPWPEMISCLGVSREAIIRLPGGVVGALHQGTPMSCQFENKVIATSGSHYYIEGGRSHKIPTAAVASCIIGRKATGSVVDVAPSTLADYTPSTEAFCPYSPIPFFARYEGDPTIWKVNPDATIQHAGSMCVADYTTTPLTFWNAQRVPLGELAGHRITSDWFASTPGCYAIRDEWIAKGYWR